MIWLRALVSIDMQMAVNMSDIGTKTNNMVLEKRNGTIWACIKDSIRTQARKVKVNTAGQMEIGM
jgi:hypothetical protein